MTAAQFESARYPTPLHRRLAAGALLACLALLGFAQYLEVARGLEPCPLCLLQRGFFALTGGIYLVALLHPQGWRGWRLYPVLATVTAALGAALAGRHVWLQHHPDPFASCGPGLEYLLANGSMAQILRGVFDGGADCSAVAWRFLGLSIPGWSLAAFVALSVLGVMLLFRFRNRGAVA